MISTVSHFAGKHGVDANEASRLAEVVGMTLASLPPPRTRAASPPPAAGLRKAATNLRDRRIFSDGDFLLVLGGLHGDLNDGALLGVSLIVVISRICGALVSHLYSTDGKQLATSVCFRVGERVKSSPPEVGIIIICGLSLIFLF